MTNTRHTLHNFMITEDIN